MSSTGSSLNSYLIAILLVCNTRSGSGAQIIYHYPPDPLASKEVNNETNRPGIGDDEEDSSSYSEESASDSDEPYIIPKGAQHSRNKIGNPYVKSFSDDESSIADLSTNLTRFPSRHILGFAEDGLVSLLTPERSWHKRKFELGINDLTFVGRPVFVRHDGTWVKRRKTKDKPPTKSEEIPPGDTQSESEDDGKTAENKANEDDAEEVEAGIESQTSSNPKSKLTMFHVVFVMNPPPLEHSAKVKEMYDHIVKKFSRVLRWEQVHHDYVWKQSEIISATKTRFSTKRLTRSQLYQEITEQSTLAAAISTIYDAITTFQIASVVLSPKVSVSLQIPPITSTAYLPSLTDPPIQPGLWLTTATDVGTIIDNDPSSSSTMELAKHYTLLLKAPPHRIAKDAQEAGGSLANHLLHFLSTLRPTKTFHKLSTSSHIPLADVRFLAQHLIDWRRAIAIPPLHQRDTYIVSPNADLGKLREATKSYESQFPASMPSLPKMLSALSGIPRPFGTLIPSSDHKEKYYLALAYLMRNGWVTQLRTFAYVRVSPEIKRKVYEADRDTRLRSTTSRLSRETSNEGKDAGRPPTTRPRLVSNPSSDGRRSLDGYYRTASHRRMASLILNPPRASVEESKWLDYINEAFSTGHDSDELHLDLSDEDRADLQKYWPAFIKYFNGRVAMETIPVRETLKRKFVWHLLAKIGMFNNPARNNDEGTTTGLLLTVRHW